MKGSQDLMNVQFAKAAFGYRQDEVDDYVNSVTATIRDLTAENKELEDKLDVLAGKLEEYREDEESLRSAILGAQKLGDKIIRDSQGKAEVIIREATTRADRLVETAQRKIEREQVALSRIQKEVADFKNRLLVLYKQHLELISSLPADDDKPAPAPAPAQEEAPASPAEPAYAPEEEDNLYFEEEETPAEIPQEEPEEPAAPEEPRHRSESKYGNLMFGDEFDFSRNS